MVNSTLNYGTDLPTVEDFKPPDTAIVAMEDEVHDADSDQMSWTRAFLVSIALTMAGASFFAVTCSVFSLFPVLTSVLFRLSLTSVLCVGLIGMILVSLVASHKKKSSFGSFEQQSKTEQLWIFCLVASSVLVQINALLITISNITARQ